MRSASQEEMFGAAVPRFGPKKKGKRTARESVLKLLRQVGAQGLTVDAIESELKLSHQTASARVHELWRGGLIEKTGERRQTRSGATANVWRTVDAKGGAQ